MRKLIDGFVLRALRLAVRAARAAMGADDWSTICARIMAELFYRAEAMHDFDTLRRFCLDVVTMADCTLAAIGDGQMTPAEADEIRALAKKLLENWGTNPEAQYPLMNGLAVRLAKLSRPVK